MNTQQRAVVQQALEALDSTDTEFATKQYYVELEAMNALRQLLEQPEQGDEPVAWWNGEYSCPVFAFKRDTPGIGLGNPEAVPLYTRPQPTGHTLTPDEAQPALPTQCWKCGDMDAMGHAKCDVPACGMREKNGGNT